MRKAIASFGKSFACFVVALWSAVFADAADQINDGVFAGQIHSEIDKNLVPRGDVADYIIRGNWRLAAYRCEYPLKVNGVYPVFPLIKDMDEMQMWAPVIFDAEERAQLDKVKKADKKTGGWDFHNWSGESFVEGRMWRTYDDKMLFVVNDVSKSLYEYWKSAYKRDLRTLAPQFRTGCSKAAYYFVTEDRSHFGRVDLMGDLWRPENLYDGSQTHNARIMLFKRGQKSSDIPWRVFNYIDTRDKEHSPDWREDQFRSIVEDFEFSDDTGCGIGDGPEMSLVFGMKSGKETILGLEKCDVWPPNLSGVK